MVRVLDVHRWFKDGVVSPLLCGVPTKETVPHASTQLTRVYIGIGNILLGVTLGYPIQRGGGGGVQVEILLVGSVEPFWFEWDLTYTVLHLTFNRERKRINK